MENPEFNVGEVIEGGNGIRYDPNLHFILRLDMVFSRYQQTGIHSVNRNILVLKR